MPTTDPRVDTYIANAAPFARPILEHLRAALHAAAPGVAEDIKWNVPQFAYKGLFAATPAFNQHVRLVLWQGKQLAKSDLAATDAAALKRLDRLQTVADIPDARMLARLIQAAVALRDAGGGAPRRTATKRSLRVPAEFATALKKTKGAAALFAKLPPSHKREYVEWIAGAKMAATRERRMKNAIRMIADGKSLTAKYHSR